LTLWPMIFYVVSNRNGYYHFPRIMAKAYFLSFPRQWWVFPCIRNIVLLCIFDNLARLYFVFFVFFCFVGLMDMSSMEENQVVHDVTQVVGNNRITWCIEEYWANICIFQVLYWSIGDRYGTSYSYGTSSSLCLNYLCKYVSMQCKGA
jgi:hypothetical protein